MPIVETLRPTASAQDTSGSGYVLDAANAFDVNPATYSRVIAEETSQHAAQFLFGFPADTYPDGRTSVIIELDVARFGWTASDRAFVWFRPSTSADFVMVAGFNIADLGTTLTAKTIDITAIAGSYPATEFEVSVQFLNDYFGDPPRPQE